MCHGRSVEAIRKHLGVSMWVLGSGSSGSLGNCFYPLTLALRKKTKTVKGVLQPGK